MLAACSEEPTSPWPAFPSLEPGDVPPDSRLGTPLSRLDNGAYVGVWAGEHFYVVGSSFDRSAGVGSVQVVQLDEVAGEYVVTELPPPPVNYFAPFAPGFTFANEGLILDSQPPVFWDGTRWLSLPQDSAGSGSLSRFIARSPTEIAHAIDDNPDGVYGHAWDGIAWKNLTFPTPGLEHAVLGSWDAAGLHVVAFANGNPCSFIAQPGTGTATVPVCASFYMGTSDPRVTGTPTDLTVGAGSHLAHYDGTQWIEGDPYVQDTFATRHELVYAPGRTGAIMRIGGDPFTTPTLLQVEAAHATTPVFPSVATTTSCSCDRTVDPSCPCVPTHLEPSYVIDPQRQRIAIITNVLLTSFGPYRAAVRFLPLPVTASPFAE